MNTIARDQLRAIVERVERLEEEKAEVAEQVKEVYAEAKSNGFCTKTLRKIVALRKKDSAEREEEQAMLDLYMSALGMLPPQESYQSTPLGKAVEGLGKPVPLTEKEKERGAVAAFERDGTRMSIAPGRMAAE